MPHPKGLIERAGGSMGRVLGMHLTIWPIVAGAVLNAGWAVLVALR